MTLLKRSSAPDAPWCLKFTHRGRQFWRSTGTTDKKLATQAARQLRKQIIDALIRGDLDAYESTKTRHRTEPTLAALWTLYQAAPIEAAPATRRQNWNCLLNVLGVEPEAAERTTAAVLEGAAKRFFASRQASAAQAGDQVAANRQRRSANQIFAQARALFTPSAREYYADQGVTSDHFVPFYESWKSRRFTGLPRKAYNPPSDQQIADTLDAWRAESDADLFLAIGLELSFGLRLGEVRQARWGWLIVRAGAPMLDTSAGTEAVHVKNQTGAILVRALDPYYSTFRLRGDRDGLRGQPEDPIIRRPAAVGNAVSAFLRRHGWTTTRTNHALRDYAGSQVYMRFSPHDAMTWLRHGNVQVTTDYYTSFVSAAKMIDRDALGVDWATVTGQFTPVVVSGTQ